MGKTGDDCSSMPGWVSICPSYTNGLNVAQVMTLQPHGPIAHQGPLSMGLSRQEYWNGLPFPTPEDLPYPGIKPKSLMSPALADGFFITSTTWEVLRPQFLTW